MKKFIVFIVLITASIIFTGCVCQGGGLTSSTKPITSKDSYTIVEYDAERASWGFLFLWPPDTFGALQGLKDDTGADALINVTVENQTILLGIINRIYIRGDAIRFNKDDI